MRAHDAIGEPVGIIKIGGSNSRIEGRRTDAKRVWEN
jgi:hypothetical protein